VVPASVRFDSVCVPLLCQTDDRLKLQPRSISPVPHVWSDPRIWMRPYYDAVASKSGFAHLAIPLHRLVDVSVQLCQLPVVLALPTSSAHASSSEPFQKLLA